MSLSGSPSPQGGDQQSLSGVPSTPPGVSMSGGVPASPISASMPVMSTSTGHGPYDDAGDVLQTSTTVTSLTVALIVFFPSTSLPKLALVTIGHISLPLGIAVLFCGVAALMSSFLSLNRLRLKSGIHGRSIMFSHIGLLFIALFLFLLIFLGVAASYVF